MKAKEGLEKPPNKVLTEISFKEVFPLKEPYAYGAVAKDPETKGLKYIVIEPTLTEEEKKQLNKIVEILGKH